jgi:predicted ester cyclase
MCPHDTAAEPARTPAVPDRDPLFEGGREHVLQVERHDYTDLAPTDRPRRQSLRGFDPVYTDIVDYIVRCTHRIWDERDVGLIYTHYTHNAVVYNALGTVYDREDIVRDTIQRLVTFPERRGMATQVIWRGNDVEGFYTSHLVTGSGRHTQPGPFGKPTGRSFTSRTIADCMVFENRIFREWLVSDAMAMVRQLGLDAHAIAGARATEMLDRGQQVVDIGENRRLLGQQPPEAEADVSLAHTESEAECLRRLHEIYNRRMFGRIRDVYAPNVQWHGPLMKELYGRAAVLHQVLALVGAIPDCCYMPQHICSVPCEEGGEKIAVRWVMEGHHLGYGMLGAPTGHRLFVMGMTHLHVVRGLIVDEWTVYDELALLTQIKLGELAAHRA